MGKKLYVGNLSYDVSSSDLEALLSPHGTVQSAEVIMDRSTGRSKGFGFVEMDSDAEAQAAIAALNGEEQGGRALTVNEAKPREPRSGGGGGYGGGGGRRDSYETTGRQREPQGHHWWPCLFRRVDPDHDPPVSDLLTAAIPRASRNGGQVRGLLDATFYPTISEAT